jgi:hypothetical protein
LPLDALRVGDEFADPEGRFAESIGIRAGGAVLVRPDGFVAWRREDEPNDAAGELRAALGSALGY